MLNPTNLFVVSAPSGAGKTSLVEALVKDLDQFCLSVSHTTRLKRPGEVDGQHYNFLSYAQFQQLVTAGEFLECAEVHDHWYGTSRQWVMDRLAEGENVVLEIDWQGAAKIREQMPDAVTIFILPPSRKILMERLLKRGQDSEDVILQRAEAAREEVAHIDEFDYIMVNDKFKTALTELKAIVLGEQTLSRAAQQERFKPLIFELMR
ncbi:MAG: guanylate kinase [Gammaproteobacteria bacterium]|nr:guanylate kinase [Gammaproteobacteria bacterium]MCP4476175.1 guanylate kinase [Gammaproteobacteria bacterium]